MDVRESLLEAAIKVFAESGMRGATTRRIASAANVNEVTLFRHFKSKDELIHAALEYFVSRIEIRPSRRTRSTRKPNSSTGAVRTTANSTNTERSSGKR